MQLTAAVVLLLCQILWIHEKADAQQPTTNGIALRLDASDINGDGKSDAGEPADGASVENWKSASGADGAGGGVSQSAKNMQPVYRAKAINGKPALEFDGASKYMERQGANLQACEIFAVVTVGKGAPGLTGVLSNGRDQLNIRRNSDATYRGNANTDGNDFVHGGGELRINGAKTDDCAPDVPHIIDAISPDANTYDSLQLSTLNHNRYWKGLVAEIIIYNRALSVQERDGVMSYLKQKYGVSIVANTANAPTSPSPRAKAAPKTGAAQAAKPTPAPTPARDMSKFSAFSAPRKSDAELSH